MPGTTQGGIRAALTNKQKYGADFYVELGRKGGKNGHTGGFYADRERARNAGRKGGLTSRRGKGKTEPVSFTVPNLRTVEQPKSLLQRLFGRISKRT